VGLLPWEGDLLFSRIPCKMIVVPNQCGERKGVDVDLRGSLALSLEEGLRGVDGFCLGVFFKLGPWSWAVLVFGDDNDVREGGLGGRTGFPGVGGFIMFVVKKANNHNGGKKELHNH